MTYRRLFFSLASLLLLGLIASPAAAGAQNDIQSTEFVDTDGDEAIYATDPTAYDTDGDLLSDVEEADLDTDPTKPDTDGDDLTDFAEVGFEPGSSTGTDPLRFDTDGDGLGDGAELRPDGWGTNPLKIDTDDDGYNDGDELFVYSTDPNDAASHPAGQVASTMIIDVRILPVDYQGNDFAGDSEPLDGVGLSIAGTGYTTDGNGRVVIGGLAEDTYGVTLGVPGDFADFITFIGNKTIPEPRQHDGQNTNNPVVYLAPNETLYGTFYVIPADARGDDPAPAPAPRPSTPVTTPITALPNTGAGIESTESESNSEMLTLIAGTGALFGLAGTLGLARRRS